MNWKRNRKKKRNISVTPLSFEETKKALTLAKEELLKNNVDYEVVWKIIEEMQHSHLGQPEPNETDSVSLPPTPSGQSELDGTLTGTYFVSSTGINKYCKVEKLTFNLS